MSTTASCKSVPSILTWPLLLLFERHSHNHVCAQGGLRDIDIAFGGKTEAYFDFNLFYIGGIAQFFHGLNDGCTGFDQDWSDFIEGGMYFIPADDLLYFVASGRYFDDGAII